MAEKRETVAGKVEGNSSTPITGNDKAPRQRHIPSTETLTDAQRFTLSLVMNAGKACKLLNLRIRNGHPISQEALQACTVLSGMAAASIGD